MWGFHFTHLEIPFYIGNDKITINTIVEKNRLVFHFIF